MRIVIIGGVAAGTSAAAKARRNNEENEIVIYEKDSMISYSACGMPFYIGGFIKNAGALTPRDPAFFKSKYNVDIFTLHEVMSVNAEDKIIEVKNLSTGEVFADTYDRLVVATGASAFVPPIKGAERSHVFTLRNIGDMNRMISFMNANKPKTSAIIGTGFIGLEVCENLKALGIEVTLIEKLPQVTPGLDSDMAVYVREHIEKNGVTVLVGASVTEITESSVKLSDHADIQADMVLISTGIKPNTSLAESAGIELGSSGAIRVNTKMQTNIKDIYACGDCTEQFHVITGKPVYKPLGSTANKTGRICGDSLTGGSLEFRGILGTGIFGIFGMTVGQTGLTEKEAAAQGFDIAVSHFIKPGKPAYMGGKEMVIKAVADKSGGRILGVQIVGYDGVDKRLDVFVTAITFKAQADDLFHLDLAYAPPFSTAKDPVMYTGMILDNMISKGRPLITVRELDSMIESGQKYNLIDARVFPQYEEEHIVTAKSIPHEDIRSAAGGLDKETVAVTYCNKGNTGNAAQNILLNKGFKKVFNLSGGHMQYRISSVKKQNG